MRGNSSSLSGQLGTSPRTRITHTTLLWAASNECIVSAGIVVLAEPARRDFGRTLIRQPNRCKDVGVGDPVRAPGVGRLLARLERDAEARQLLHPARHRPVDAELVTQRHDRLVHRHVRPRVGQLERLIEREGDESDADQDERNQKERDEPLEGSASREQPGDRTGTGTGMPFQNSAMTMKAASLAPRPNLGRNVADPAPCTAFVYAARFVVDFDDVGTPNRPRPITATVHAAAADDDEHAAGSARTRDRR